MTMLFAFGLAVTAALCTWGLHSLIHDTKNAMQETKAAHADLDADSLR